MIYDEYINLFLFDWRDNKLELIVLERNLILSPWPCAPRVHTSHTELTLGDVNRNERTFHKDAQQFRVHDGVLNTTDPYFPNEPSRHKLLDFIGDVRLVGMPLRGHFSIYKPGHRANVAFGIYLMDYIKTRMENGSGTAPHKI